MLNITINNVIHLKTTETNRYPELKKKIKEDLTLANPAYISCLKRGKRPWKIPKYIQLWSVRGSEVILPRGYWERLKAYLFETDLQYQVDYRIKIHPHVNFKSKIELRDYQTQAIEAVMKSVNELGQGIIVGPCGCGKTQIGLQIVSDISQPTLWICHTKELLYQTVDRASEFLGIEKKDIGIIGAGEFHVGKELTVGLVQSMVKTCMPINLFGTIICDENHHCPSYTFDRVIQEFPAAYRYGLTATLDRADGLTPAMLAIMGPVIHTIPQSAVPTITPGLRIIPTYYKAAGADYSAIMEDLIQAPERNRIILDAIKEDIENKYTLVLSDRIEHLEILAANLAEECPQVKAAVITGQLGKKERQRIMEETVGKEIRVLFATQLAREGLDIPHLDRLFMVTPKRARGAVQQEVGRIMRPCNGKKTAVVIDFLDNNGMLQAQFKERKKVYRELGMME